MTRETERESSGSLWGLGIFNSAKKGEWLQPTGEGQEVSETEEDSLVQQIDHRRQQMIENPLGVP